MRILVLLFVGGALLGGGSACAKKKGSSTAAAPDANFSKPVTASSTLEIGHQTLAGTKLVPKNQATSAADPARDVFEAELYPKLRVYCAAGCHDVNQRPFASDGVSLAFEIAKPFMSVNADDSQMIINIKSSHNGTNPAWAAEVGPAITKVAEAMAD